MAYKVLALVMLFIGGIAAYTFVWDLGDVGIGLMTLFNISILYPLSKEAFRHWDSMRKRKRRNRIFVKYLSHLHRIMPSKVNIW